MTSKSNFFSLNIFHLVPYVSSSTQYVYFSPVGIKVKKKDLIDEKFNKIGKHLLLTCG